MAESRPVLITVDGRERSAGGQQSIEQHLQKIPTVTLDRKNLESGDFAFADVLIERKAGQDLMGSIMSGRMFAQVELLRSSCERPIVLIEGDPYAILSQVDCVAIDGALSWLAVLSGVQVVWSQNSQHSAQLIYRMAVHATHGLGYTPPFRGEKPKLEKRVLYGRYMLEGLPGIGPDIAMRLLDHFGSPLKVFNATVAELCQVQGIAKGRAEKIVAAVNCSR